MRTRMPLLMLMLPAAACAPDAYTPHGEIEAAYYQPGPYPVPESISFDCCTRDGGPLLAWLPDTEAPAPVVVWGNGTAATTDDYHVVIGHLASWGFAVIAPESGSLGDGAPLLQALDAAEAAAADPGSPLYGRLDLDNIGAMGHSQGAGGVTNLMMLSDERVQALVTVARPAPQWCTEDALCPSPAGITSGAVMYLTGSRDILMSPPSAQARFFEETRDGVTKVRATLQGARHVDIQGDPGCDGVTGCGRGADGYMGYPAAWLAAHLQGDRDALSAFTADGELAQAQPDWRGVMTNVEQP